MFHYNVCDINVIFIDIEHILKDKILYALKELVFVFKYIYVYKKYFK